MKGYSRVAQLVIPLNVRRKVLLHFATYSLISDAFWQDHWKYRPHQKIDRSPLYLWFWGYRHLLKNLEPDSLPLQRQGCPPEVFCCRLGLVSIHQQKGVREVRGCSHGIQSRDRGIGYRERGWGDPLRASLKQKKLLLFFLFVCGLLFVGRVRYCVWVVIC